MAWRRAIPKYSRTVRAPNAWVPKQIVYGPCPGYSLGMVSLGRSALSQRILPIVFIFSTGCASLEKGARDYFVRELSCPMDRVTVRARPDLHYGDLLLIPSTSKPSAEIAADPERLALWKENHAKDLSERRARASKLYDVFEVTGCGRTVQLGCRHPTDSRGRTEISAVTCSMPNPAGIR